MERLKIINLKDTRKDTQKENIKQFIDDFCEKASNDEKVWFEIKIKKSFPEYCDFLKRKSDTQKPLMRMVNKKLVVSRYGLGKEKAKEGQL